MINWVKIQSWRFVKLCMRKVNEKKIINKIIERIDGSNKIINIHLFIIVDGWMDILLFVFWGHWLFNIIIYGIKSILKWKFLKRLDIERTLKPEELNTLHKIPPPPIFLLGVFQEVFLRLSIYIYIYI